MSKQLEGRESCLIGKPYRLLGVLAYRMLRECYWMDRWMGGWMGKWKPGKRQETTKTVSLLWYPSWSIIHSVENCCVGWVMQELLRRPRMVVMNSDTPIHMQAPPLTSCLPLVWLLWASVPSLWNGGNDWSTQKNIWGWKIMLADCRCSVKVYRKNKWMSHQHNGVPHMKGIWMKARILWVSLMLWFELQNPPNATTLWKSPDLYFKPSCISLGM